MVPQRKIFGGFANQMFKHAYLYSQMRKGDIPDIYVQSEKYWEPFKHEIKAMYSEGIKPIDKVALHIRRGDYVDNPFYVNLWTTDYYENAIAQFPNENFLVFCRDNQDWEQDKADREWCRINLTPLLGDRWELPSRYNKEHEDFNLMVGCKALIGANSSFSWWAAYLGDEKKKVIMPKEWFSDGEKRIDLLPQWQVI